MSKIQLDANASGTGVFTIASPSGNTDRTVTLPDSDGEFVLSASGTISNFASTGIDDNATSTAITIDASQNVGIGTNPSSNLHVYNGADAEEQVIIAEVSGGYSNGAGVSLRRDGTEMGRINADYFEGMTFHATTGGGGAATERMRINSSGNVMINTTSSDGVFNVYNTGSWIISSKTNSTGTVGHIRFDNGNGFVGSIQTSGSSTAYYTTSDYRLKENVIDLTGAANRLKQIPVYRFNFIADPDITVDGFLAHEVADVVPEAISGAKDEVNDEGNPVYQGIDQSKLVPLLTAALQEALTKIESLETRLSALEAN